jgi:uncharacterized protein DUF4214
MSRNSHRSFQPERVRSVLISILLVAMTSSFVSLPRPTTAIARKTVRLRGNGPTEKPVRAATVNAANIRAGANARGMVMSAAQPQASSLPGRLIYQTRPSGYGMNMINPDGTNRVNLTDYGAGVLDRPSVSEQTGMVSFEAADLKITPPMDFQDHRIFVMNGDGTGIKQITFPPNPGPDARNTQDNHPKISPDGTKVAFVSFRTAGQTISCPNTTHTTTTNREVWVVNVDGSNLHQVTTPKVSFDTGGGCGASDNLEVAWSADSGQLVVMGTRPYSFTVMPRSPGMFDSLAIVGAGGGGSETTVALDIPEPLPGQPDEPVVRANIAPRDGNGVGFLDWSLSGTILFSSTMNNQNGSLGQMVQGGQPSYRLTQDLMGQSGLIWYACYSPDGAHFLISGRSSSTGDNSDHLFIDSSGGLVPNTGTPSGGVEWAPGPVITTPNKMTLAPNPLFLYGQTPVRVTPSLLDADSNVIVHTAQWRVDGAGFRCDNTADEIPCTGNQLQAANNVDFTGLVKGGSSESQGNLCGVNGGVMGCTPYFNTQASAFLSITATTPTALTSGTGGPGVFTIKREGTPPSMPPISVGFTVSGTAVRDVDYTFDFTGNNVVLPSGQSSVNINVRPLRAQTSDKTVIITLQPDSLKNYIVSQNYRSGATVTIKNDIVVNVLSLLRVTPNAGGDQGVIQATVYGQNIQQGATVKLSRSGQADIIGENPFIETNGSAISARFNLMGKAQGAWDVFVTNPDNTNAQLANAFTIQPTKAPHIWVDISGRDAIRASHTATTYTITYGNSGNVDAYVVPFVLMGVPLNAEFKLLFNTSQIPGVTDPNLSPTFQTQTDQRLLLFLPIVRANSTNYLRFTLRANSFPDGSFELQALAGLPLYKPVANPAFSAAKQPHATARRLLRFANHASTARMNSVPITSFTSFLLSGSPEALDCWNSIVFGALFNCASAFLPGVGWIAKGSAIEQCLASALNMTAGLVASSITAHTTNNDQFTPVALAQMSTSAVGTGADCLEALGSGIPGLGSFLGALGCATSIGDTLFTCYSDYKKYKARTVGSVDPNEKVGLRGVTAENYTTGTQPLSYTVFFENQATATAPAQTVVVTDQLDVTKFDLSTFTLGLMGFGSTVVTPPQGVQTYDTDLDLRPAKNLIVRIHAVLDNSTGLVTWKFQSIDPATNQPPTDPLAGFLPPDTDGVVGEGSVLYSVMPKAALASGTQIINKATITFDLNASLDTNMFTNTIDNSAPVSHVGALSPAQPFVVFLVSWSGMDSGSGVRDYTVYVSANGGAYSPWIYHTTQKSAYYLGQPSTIYSFYTMATDNANNQEAVKTNFEASTATRSDITNVIDDTRFFVYQHYLDFLNRQPDAPGLDHWTGEITMCSDPANRLAGETEAKCIDRKRTNTSGAFYLSNEFQNSANFLIRVNWGSLGQDRDLGRKCIVGQYAALDAVCRPLYSQYIADMGLLTQGIVVNDQLAPSAMNANRRNFVNQFVTRADFLEAYPTSLTAAEYVNKLSQSTGVPLTTEERSELIVDVTTPGAACASWGFTNTQGRGCALYKIVDGTTIIDGGYLRFDTRYGKAYYDQEFNPAFVFIEYLGYLRRNPDQGGYDHWSDKLNFYGNFVDAEMVRSFLVSDEYRQRFGPR